MNRLARLLVVIALVAATTGGARAVAADAGTTTAVIVIDTGSSVRAVTVDVGGGISGLAALQRVASVGTYGFTGQGGAVCSIDGVGNDATQASCLVGPNSQYWAYFHSNGGTGAWMYSPVGAGSFTVHGGDVEGWRYGTGTKPAASPVFCDYVTCAPPATTTPPSGGSGGAATAPAGGSAGAATPGSGGAATGSTGGSTSGATPTAGSGADGSAAAADSPPPSSTTLPDTDQADTSSARRNTSGARVEAAGAETGGGPDADRRWASWSRPGFFAIAAASAVWFRRRSRTPG